MATGDYKYCEVRTCDEGDGAAIAKYFCKTEQRYVCEQDFVFCQTMGHHWKELPQKAKTLDELIEQNPEFLRKKDETGQQKE